MQQMMQMITLELIQFNIVTTKVAIIYCILHKLGFKLVCLSQSLQFVAESYSERLRKALQDTALSHL